MYRLGCVANAGRWGDLRGGGKFFVWCGLRGGMGILCRKQLDRFAAAGEAAEFHVDAGVGQRQDGIAEFRRKGSRVWAEREELQQFGGRAAPAGRGTEECADGIDKGVAWGRRVEGFEHFGRGAVEGGGGGLRPSEGGGVAGSG